MGSPADPLIFGSQPGEASGLSSEGWRSVYESVRPQADPSEDGPAGGGAPVDGAEDDQV